MYPGPSLIPRGDLLKSRNQASIAEVPTYRLCSKFKSKAFAQAYQVSCTSSYNIRDVFLSLVVRFYNKVKVKIKQAPTMENTPFEYAPLVGGSVIGASVIGASVVGALVVGAPVIGGSTASQEPPSRKTNHCCPGISLAL